MSAPLTGPLPCADCDAYIASAALDTQPHLRTLRWFLDNRETAADRPHQHVADARADDLRDADAAITRELADAKEIDRVFKQLFDLMNVVVLTGERETTGEGLARLEAEGSTTTTHMVNALTERLLALEGSRTWYLGGKPTIGRDADGNVYFRTA